MTYVSLHVIVIFKLEFLRKLDTALYLLNITFRCRLLLPCSANIRAYSQEVLVLYVFG